MSDFSDGKNEAALRDFLYEIAYENIDTELGKKLYNMLEEEEDEGLN